MRNILWGTGENYIEIEKRCTNQATESCIKDKGKKNNAKMQTLANR